MKVRVYCKEEGADGRDEGGFYRWEEQPEIPAKLRARMVRCSGCHDAFYNHRANVAGNHCWHLAADENFPKDGPPRCWHRK
jgi:formylmethanofuran dehydrogenase subunit E